MEINSGKKDSGGERKAPPGQQVFLGSAFYERTLSLLLTEGSEAFQNARPAPIVKLVGIARTV